MDRTFLYCILTYILLINLAGFAVFGTDKLLAKRQRRRVPEATLLLLAAAGAAAGELAAMYLFRHKTLHRKFSFGLPILLALQLGLLVYLGLIR